MFNNRFKFDATADLAKSILEADTKAKMEELKGKQTKLDKNHNGKLDAQDFKMLRGEKKPKSPLGQSVAEGSATDRPVNYTLGHAPDRDHVYSIHRDGEKEGTYHSVDQAKQIVANMKKTSPHRSYKITRSPRSKMAGPKGQLPEQSVEEEVEIDEAEASYQSSYRVGKVANFKPKASDVGQGRKISGKMGKYGKQPDDDNMVEPPPEHTVGVVKTDPSAVVPGHSTMGAKLHLASLPKDAEGNTIHKGARRVNAADLVAKRKAMMAGQKNEEVESLEEKNWIAGAIKHPGGLHKALGVPQDEKIPASKVAAAAEKGGKIGKMARLAQTLKGLKKQNEEVESINEEDPYIGSKEERSEIWTKHAHAAHNGDDHEEEKISRHARNLFGKHFAHDMEQHSNHYVMKNKFSTSRGEERDHISQMDKLAKRQHVDNEHLKHDHLVKESLDERTLTSGETKEKERIVHGMKKSLKGFKARYGDRAKEVMYAAATKQAKKD